MDSKDFQLLLELGDNARQSYQSLGRRLSLSAPAVCARFDRLKMKGILQGFNLMINPSVFDRAGIVLFFRGEFERKTALAALAVPDVYGVTLKLDGQMVVGLWTRNEEKRTNYLTNILGTKPSGRLPTPRINCPSLSIVDLSIMDALVDDPVLPIGELVKSTRLSPKTVRNHLKLLLESKTIFIVPIHGNLADSGEVIYPLAVAGSVAMIEVQRILGETALLRDVFNPPMKYMLCKGNSLADMLTKIQALEKVTGVNSVEISLNREVLVSKDLRHSLIREEMRKLENNRATPRQ